MDSNIEVYLLSCLQKKDTAAFKFLYEHYFTQMVLFAESYLYDKEEARDIVQDLFFHLWDNASRTEVNISVKAYLFTSLRNRCLNVLRDSKVRDSHNDKLFEAQVFSGTEDIKIDECIRQRLHDALDSLPDKCREIFLLKVVHGKKNKEIAQELGISDYTVKTHIQRAYKSIRGKMIPILLFLEWFHSTHMD